MFIDSRTKYITKVVSRYDRELYAKRNRDGILCVFRKGKRAEELYRDDDMAILGYVDSPSFVLALTDNWKTSGKPRDWGALLVEKKLKDMDAWADPELLDKFDKQNEKVDEIRKKDFRNNTEAWVSDNKRMFQKAFSEINTANLSKREIRKENDEKNFKIKGEK